MLVVSPPRAAGDGMTSPWERLPAGMVGLDEHDVVERRARLRGPDGADHIGEQVVVEGLELGGGARRLRLVEDVVAGHLGATGEAGRHRGPRRDEPAADAVDVVVEAVPCPLDRRRAVAVAPPEAGREPVGERRPRGGAVPPLGRRGPRRARGGVGRRDEGGVGVLVHVDDRVDAVRRGRIDGGLDLVEVALVDGAAGRLDARPRDQQADHREATGRHGVPVGVGQRDGGRDGGDALPVLAERVDVGAAEQDVAARGVDDAPVGRLEREQVERGPRLR